MTRRMVPFVLLGALMFSGCEHLVFRAVEHAINATESWPGKIAVLVVSVLFIALLKWALEEGQEQDEDGDADRDRRPR